LILRGVPVNIYNEVDGIGSYGHGVDNLLIHTKIAAILLRAKGHNEKLLWLLHF